MTPAEVFERLRAEGVEGVLEFLEGGNGDPSIVVEPARLPEILEFLRDDEALRFDQLSLVSGLHLEDRFECVYHLLSTRHRHAAVLRVRLDAADPRVPSAAGVHPAANWHERETFDLVGIVFEGHPDPRRIYLPADWEGHPLRRDYVMPREYGGIPLYDANREAMEREAKEKERNRAAGSSGEERDG